METKYLADFGDESLENYRNFSAYIISFDSKKHSLINRLFKGNNQLDRDSVFSIIRCIREYGVKCVIDYKSNPDKTSNKI